MYYIIAPSNADLYHHGILGQKWGHRNGPPYPLGSGAHSAAEKAAGYQKSIKGKDTKEKLAAELVGLGVWAAANILLNSRYIKSAAIDPLIAKNRNKKIEKSKTESTTDTKTGLKLKSKTDTTIQEDAKNVNPMYGTHEDQYTNNCSLCSAAYDMRRRGYNVTARDSTTGRTRKEQAEWYKGGKFKTVNADTPDYKARASMIAQELSKQGDGARGLLGMRWKIGGGHSIAYEVQNGKTYFIDAQANKIMDEKDFRKYTKQMVTHTDMPDCIQYMRTDNLQPNIKKIKEVIR